MTGWMKDIRWEPVKLGARLESTQPTNARTTDEAAAYPKPAGFWVRFFADYIDNFILSAPWIPFYFLMGIRNGIGLVLLSHIPALVYKPFMEARYGATWGKMICAVRVVDAHGEKLTVRAAFARFSPFLANHLLDLVFVPWMFTNLGSTDITRISDLIAFSIQTPYVPLRVLFGLLILVDCLAAAFTDRKRALHDMLAGSYCVRQLESPPERRP